MLRKTKTGWDAGAATSATSAASPPAADLPIGWEDMEIEAKWGASRNAFERIISEMPDGGSLFGYQLDVRWGGIPRKFVDRYYDTEQGSLAQSSHALRHRTRSTSNPRAPSRGFSELVNAFWPKDWERIQYKSTPFRRKAVWFRKEVGDCKIWDQADEDLCSGLPTAEAAEIIRNPAIAHEATAFLMSDHPDLERPQLRPYLVVTDFRYRVEFKLDGNAVFELSMDHLMSENLRTGKIGRQYEVELEVISKSSKEENLRDLFRVATIMEDRYELEPSTMSKGGNEVPESPTQEIDGPSSA